MNTSLKSSLTLRKHCNFGPRSANMSDVMTPLYKYHHICRHPSICTQLVKMWVAVAIEGQTWPKVRHHTNGHG